MPSTLGLLVFLPQFLAILGLFAGRAIARRMGACPHRGKVWGAFVFPLMTLPFLPAPFGLLPLLVSGGAAIGAGLTAHSSMRKTLGATLLAVFSATIGSVLLLQ